MKETMLVRETKPSPSPGGCVSKTLSVTEIGELWGSWKPSKASISLGSPPDSPSAVLSPRVHRYSQTQSLIGCCLVTAWIYLMSESCFSFNLVSLT